MSTPSCPECGKCWLWSDHDEDCSLKDQLPKWRAWAGQEEEKPTKEK